MRFLSALTVLAASCVPQAFAAAPKSIRVQNAASSVTRVAPGTLISIFGLNLAAGTESADSNTFPTMLSGTKVTASGALLPLLYVSPRQINALVPLGTVGTEVNDIEGSPSKVLSIVVQTSEGKSDAASVALLEYAPGLFSHDASGHGQVIALSADGQLADSVLPGDLLTFFATGLGPVDAEGNCVTKPVLLFGGSPVDAQTAFLTEVPGVYEISARVPAQLKANELGIFGSSSYGAEQSTQPMTLPLAPSTSVRNVVAEVQAIYPGANVKADITPVPWVGQVQLSFTVPPAAKPFGVVLKLRYSRQTLSTVDVDPAAGTAKVSLIVPSAKERSGDFSGSGFTALDLVTGLPFPGGRVPGNRLDPAALAALQSVPLPNSASGMHETTVPVQTGATFALSPELGYFATYVDLPAGSSGSTLYDEVVVFVDGREITAKEFSFDVQ